MSVFGNWMELNAVTGEAGLLSGNANRLWRYTGRVLHGSAQALGDRLQHGRHGVHLAQPRENQPRRFCIISRTSACCVGFRLS